MGTSSFRALAEALQAVSQTTSKLEKVRLLAAYFHTLSDDDLRTACIFLTGAPFPAGDARKLNVGWAALMEMLREMTGRDDKVFHDAYLRHGDLGLVAEELLGTTHRPESNGSGLSLSLDGPPLTLAVVREAFEAIAGAAGKGSRGLKVGALRRLFTGATPLEAKFLIKIMTSDLRAGLKEGLLEDAIAAAFAPTTDGASERRRLLPLVRNANMLISHVGEVAVMARHDRLDEATLQLFRPFHFMLAETIYGPEEAFAMLREDGTPPVPVLAEDKYDGIRAQVHKADGKIAIYTRTLDDITTSFPELLPELETLAGRYIIDGEILAWQGGKPLPFGLLQQRLRRKDPGLLVREIPLVLFVFDLLHLDGQDLLTVPLRERRARLEEGLRFGDRVRISNAGATANPADLAIRFRQARTLGNEGLVVKHLDSVYTPGRRGRQWMKLKEELATLDVVVIAAEHGHGKRAAVLSDVTFAVRDGDRLATIGKAYSGLTDQEIADLTRWFQEHTTRDLGRVKMVKPLIVLEVAFDQIMPSDRHDSGFALRFPRIKRLRDDKKPEEINTLEDVKEIYERQIVRVARPSAAEARR